MRLLSTPGRLAPALVALCLAVAGPAAARSFTVDDLLKLERFDRAEITPDGRHLVLQTEAAYDTAARFDFNQFSAPYLGRVKIADLHPARPARDLLPPAPGTAYVAGPLSPSGRAMVVQRMKDGVWDTGVVDLDTGEARWFPLPAETAVWGRSFQWRSETRLVALVLPPGTLPWGLRPITQTTERLPALWRDAAAGVTPTASVVGSGRDLSLWPAPRAMRLVEIDLASGRVRELARGGFIDFELSPDGRFAAALGEAEPLQPAADDTVRVATPGRRRALTLVDLTTGAATAPLPDRDLLTHLLAWSPGGDRLLVFGRRPGADWSDGDLLQVDAGSGEVTTPARGRVVPEVAYLGAGLGIVRAGWLGDRPIVFARRAGDPRADWFRLSPSGPVNLTASLKDAPPRLAAVDRDHALAVAGGSAYSLDAAGRARTLAAAPGLRPIFALRFGEGDRFDINGLAQAEWAWAAGGDGLRRLTATRAESPLPLPPNETVVAAGDRGPIVTSWRDETGVQTLGVRDRGARDVIATLNAALADVDVTPVRAIRHPGPDGRIVTSWLYLPPHPAAGRRPPLIVLPYPGSVSVRPPARYAPDALVFTPNARLLAAHGYAVLAPSLPRDQVHGDPAAGLADQILVAVDAVLAEGLADPDRLALWGHSFGGYGALVTAAQTVRFRAIVAQAAKAELASGWGALPPAFRVSPEDGPMINTTTGWAETGQGDLGAPPWRDPERYRRNSPLFLADRIRTPLFLIHGDQDFVSLANAEALFAALYRQGRDARFMTLFGESHTIGSPANVREIYAEVLPWLDRALDVTAPDASAPPDRPSPAPRSPGP